MTSAKHEVRAVATIAGSNTNYNEIKLIAENSVFGIFLIQSLNYVHDKGTNP